MAEFHAQGITLRCCFWVGCAGSFDDRAKKITKAFVRILQKANVKFAVLGAEEAVLVTLQNVLGMSFISNASRNKY